jgi:hypothetical protein
MGNTCINKTHKQKNTKYINKKSKWEINAEMKQTKTIKITKS